MARLMVVNNPKKKKRKPKKKLARKKKKKVVKKKKIVKKKRAKKKVARKKVAIRKKSTGQEKSKMAKKRRKKSTRKSVARRSTPTVKRKTRRTRRRGFGRAGGLIQTTIMPAAIGGAGAVALDVVLAMLPLPPPMKSGPGKLLIKGGAAIAGGMALSKVVDKKIGNAFMLGGLTLLAADLTKMMLSNTFPNLSLSAYDDYYDYGDGMDEYMSEYMSGVTPDDLGFISSGPIVGTMDYGDSYDQDGLGIDDLDMDSIDGELVEIDEF